MANYTNYNGQQINILNNSGNIEIKLGAKKDINLNVNIPKKLVSRDEMLAKLQNEYENGNNCVVISGIGGSGKTSLAYLYIKEQIFNNVAWVIVNGSIEDAFLTEMTLRLYKDDNERSNFIQNYDKQEKIKILTNKLSDIEGKNLLVFDINTNNDAIKQEIENQIHKYLPSNTNWKNLILTRAFAENPTRFATIKMDKMAADDAKELFLNNWKRTKIVFSQDQLAEITKELYYHPLLIEQTAIVFSKGHEKSADEIIIKIKENSKINNPRTKKILSGLAIEDKEQQDIYTYLINLCNIENLSDDEINFLAVYVTWPEEPIDYEVIETLMPNNEDALDSLVEKGILSHNDSDQYTIHSLMADVLREQINIKEFDYCVYIFFIHTCRLNEVGRITFHKYSKCIASSFINYGICNDVVLFTRFLNDLCNNNDVIPYNLPEPKFTYIVKKLEENAEPYQVANLYNAVARAEAFKNNLADAKTHYEKALRIMEGVDENEETLNLKGALLNNLAMLKKDLDDTDSAKKHYEESLEIEMKLPETPQYLDGLATTLNNLAMLEKKLGDTNSAKKHYEEAVEVNRKLLGMTETPQYLDSLATTLHNLADLEETLGDTDSAKKHYEESLEIKRKLPETPKYLDSLSTTLMFYAKLEENLGDTDSAKKLYEESLELSRKLSEMPQYLKGFIAALEVFAVFEENLGDVVSAKKHYEESLEIRRKLPETPQYLNELASTLHNLADLEEDLGDTDSAKKHYEESLEIGRKLPETPQNLDSIATALGNLARLEENLGDTDSAKQHYEETLKIGRKLPETPQNLDNLALTLDYLADLEQKLGDIDSAKKHREEELEIRRKFPETPQYLENLGLTLACLAVLEKNLGDTDSAKKHLEEGLKISRQINDEEAINAFELVLSMLPHTHSKLPH